jgi:hypothetical protein
VATQEAQPPASSAAEQLVTPIQGTQDAVAATQKAVAKNLQIIEALNRRMQQLQSTAQLLVNRASEQSPTALNSGSSVG